MPKMKVGEEEFKPSGKRILAKAIKKCDSLSIIGLVLLLEGLS